MKIFDLSDFSEISSLPGGGCAALGNFDGVHTGHMALFDEAKKSPVPVVCTFFTPAKPRRDALFLTDTAERLRLFRECGMRFAVLEDFQSIRDYSPEKFVDGYLKNKLKISAAVCGENYHFGAGGKGTASSLRALCEKAGITCTVVSSVKIDGCTVSSSAIREMIVTGDIERARNFLGHPFSADLDARPWGSAGHTAAVTPAPGMAFPESGVFAARVTVCEKAYPAAVYIGENYPYGVDIIGFDGDIPEKLRLDLLKRISDGEPLSHKVPEDECIRIFRGCSERIES